MTIPALALLFFAVPCAARAEGRGAKPPQPAAEAPKAEAATREARDAVRETLRWLDDDPAAFRRLPPAEQERRLALVRQHPELVAAHKLGRKNVSPDRVPLGRRAGDSGREDAAEDGAVASGEQDRAPDRAAAQAPSPAVIRTAVKEPPAPRSVAPASQPAKAEEPEPSQDEKPWYQRLWDYFGRR